MTTLEERASSARQSVQEALSALTEVLNEQRKRGVVVHFSFADTPDGRVEIAKLDIYIRVSHEN